MDRYAILLGYFEKQLTLIEKLYTEVTPINLAISDKRFVFALKTQQLYTAIEDLFKQIAKSFENHIETMSNFHKEILVRMNTEIPKIRPAVISQTSFRLLDKIRAFRHFIRHAYDCELDEVELKLIQNKLREDYSHVKQDLQNFHFYIKKLT